MPYHAQRLALFWRGMMTLKMSGAPLEHGPSYLVLLHTKLTTNNSRTVQGERTQEGAQREGGTADGGTDIFGEAQGGGGSVPTVNRASVLERRSGQVEITAE